MLTKDEIMALTGRELDAAVGREVMGYSVYHYNRSYSEYWLLWDREANPVLFPSCREDATIERGERDSEAEAWADTPRFEIDTNAVRDMEAEVRRRELGPAYAYKLAEFADYSESKSVYLDIWWCVTAPLETKCRAALLCVMEREAGNGQ